MPLNDRQDLLDARKAADQAMPQPGKLLALAGPNADEFDLEMVGAAYSVAQAFRLEIRALGVAISHALDEAIRARP